MAITDNSLRLAGWSRLLRAGFKKLLLDYVSNINMIPLGDFKPDVEKVKKN